MNEQETRTRKSRHNHIDAEVCTENCPFYFHVQVSKLCRLIGRGEDEETNNQLEKVRSLLFASQWEWIEEPEPVRPEIEIGSEWFWGEIASGLREHIRVTDKEIRGGEWWIKSELVSGGRQYWNSADRFLEASVKKEENLPWDDPESNPLQDINDVREKEKEDCACPQEKQKSGIEVIISEKRDLPTYRTTHT